MADRLIRLASPATLHRRATIEPESYDETTRSFEVVFATDAPVARIYRGEYHDEVLEISERAMRRQRLEAGGPLLDSHRSDDLSRLIGSAVPGTIRIAGNEARARVRLCEDADGDRVASKVKGGHLKGVSTGYAVHEFKVIERGKGARDELRATDWEPLEISLCAVQADPNASIRGRSEPMPQEAEIETIEEQPQGDARSGGRVTARQIRELCRRSDQPAEFVADLLERHDDRPFAIADVQAILAERVAEDRPRGVIRATMSVSDPEPGQSLTAQRMQAALEARLTGGEPPADARDYMGMTAVDMARELLEARGFPVRRSSAAEVVRRSFGGLHTTSDFVAILGNAVNAVLAAGYEAQGGELRQIARPRELSDFKDAKWLRIGEAPPLLKVNEHGEFQRGTITESSATISLDTFGRIFGVSRQAIVNDNLGALSDMTRLWAEQAAALRAGLLAALVNSNVVLDDGTALFHADHGNLAASGAAISVATLTTARAAMRAQTGLDGVTKISAVPKFLVVGPARETEAEQVLATLSAAQISNVNPFSGKLTLIVDPYLTGTSWYLFADPGQAPVLELARLRGQPEVWTDTRVGWDIDGIEFKARVDAGAAAVDHRGAYRNPGA